MATLRRVSALAATGLMLVSCGARPRPALVDIGAGLQGPPGLVATVYTNGLPTASAIALDAQGRLWVATADYADQGKDGVYVVAQAGATPVEVVGGLHTPLGVLWYEQSLYVASTGRVDAYRDFDGTRFATHRVVLTFEPGVGSNNGLALAADGRLRMGISAPCDHCAPTSLWSATIVSFRPDGSDLRVEANGIRAPIGLTYYPGTNDLFVTMNHRDDLGAQTPGDWLAIVRQGESWGFPSCWGQGGTACAGVPGPVAELDKHAAVSGVAIVTGQLGAAVGTSAIIAEWALGKVQQVALDRKGDTYTGTVAPFLSGLKNPVPVVVSPDGAVFVGDWGSGTIYQIRPR